MFGNGWLKKAETLRMVLLSGGHQMAKELPPGIVKMLHAFEEAAQTGDGTHLSGVLAEINREHADDPKPLWEPAEIYGWHFDVTFYRRDDELWWLCHATRKNEFPLPSDKDLAFLDKVLKHLGCDPKTDTVIGPTSSPPGHDRLQFGWWTWRNVAPLYELQVNKAKKGRDMMRIVRLGAPESEGYVSVDLSKKADASP